MLPRLLQCQIDRFQVLQSTLRGNELMSRFCRVFISFPNAQWQPSLLNLWIKSCGQVEIVVDTGQDWDVYLIYLTSEALKEHNLQVAVVVIEFFVPIRGECTVTADISVSESGRSVRVFRCEIKEDWRKAWLVDPGIPVHRCEDSVCLCGIVVIFNENFPRQSEIISDHRLLLVA